MQYYIILDSIFGDIKYACAERYKISNIADDAKYHCPTCGKNTGGLEWLPPYLVQVSNKKKLADFLFGVDPFIVNESFKTKYEASGLTGLSNFRLVELYYRRKPLDIPYYLPDIAHEFHKVDLSGFVPNKPAFDPKQLCPTCQRLGGNAWYDEIKHGIVFLHPEKIDKDIFVQTIPKRIIVSERFKCFVEEQGFTNFKMFPAEKYLWSQNEEVLYDNGVAWYSKNPLYMRVK